MDVADFVAEQVLAECREDHVWLWSIVGRVRLHLPESQVRETTLAIIRKLLVGGHVVAGQFRDNQFTIWDEPPERSLAKIATEWTELGRDPTLGDIVWLTGRTVN